MPISCWIWKPVQNYCQQVDDGNCCCCVPAAGCAFATSVAAPLAFVFDALTCGQVNAKNSWEFPTPCDVSLPWQLKYTTRSNGFQNRVLRTL